MYIQTPHSTASAQLCNVQTDSRFASPEMNNWNQHVYKKRRQNYVEKLQDKPKENIKTIFKVWTEFTYGNFKPKMFANGASLLIQEIIKVTCFALAT